MKRSPPRALILTAGLGTRLRPLTDVRAKGAVPVNGEPLVRRVIRWLATAGITDLVLNLHHRPESIAAVVGDGGDLGVRVRYSWEQPVLGSAGGPRHALPLLVDGGRDPFLLVNGDTLTDVPLDAMLETHHESGAVVTMALIPNPRPDKYGGVRVSDDGWIEGFARPGAPGASFHFVGVQAAHARVFETLEDGRPAESVAALYPSLLARHPRSIRAFVCSAAFRDIGTPRDYLDTSLALAEIEGDRLQAGRRTKVARDARVIRTAVWDDVAIGARARLTDCVVCDGVTIEPGAVFDRSAIVRAGIRAPAADERREGELLIRPID